MGALNVSDPPALPSTFVKADQRGVRSGAPPITLLSMSLQVRPISAEPAARSPWYRRLIKPRKSRWQGGAVTDGHASRADNSPEARSLDGVLPPFSGARERTRGAIVALARRQRSRVAGAAVGSISLLYASTKITIKIFHHLRRKQLREMMVQTLPVLESLGQQHWVDFGSLLGLIRGGDLILHDNDVDVVVLNPNWPELQAGLEKQLKGKYRVAAVRPSEDPSVMWLRVYSLFGMMDVYGAYDRGGCDIEIEIGRERLLDLPKELVLPTTEISFRGKSIRVPGSAKKVLQLRYGDTWMIPRYMDKGHDTIEQGKPYVKLLRAIAALGIRI